MIEVEHVSKQYGLVQAIQDVSFTVKPGEIVGLLGPNGAGKTTLLRVLTGYHYPSSGNARICNIDVVSNPLLAKKQTGYLPESTPLYEDLTVYEYLEFAASARGLKKKESIERVLQLCTLTSVVHRPITELSKGFRQRVGLAQSLIHDPDVVILDEPTSGLDPNQIMDIRDVIRKLGNSKTVILSTHIMQEVEVLCDRVLIMNHGSIVAAGSPDEIALQIQGDTIYNVTIKGRVPKSIEKSVKDIESVLTANLQRQEGNISDFHFICNADENAAEQIFDWVVSKKLKLLRLERERTNLEKTFTLLTKGEQEEKEKGGKS